MIPFYFFKEKKGGFWLCDAYLLCKVLFLGIVIASPFLLEDNVDRWPSVFLILAMIPSQKISDWAILKMKLCLKL